MPEGRSSASGWSGVGARICCLALLILALWGFVEYRYLGGGEPPARQALYLTRGAASSLLIGLLMGALMVRERRRHKDELEQACERYQSILNKTPAPSEGRCICADIGRVLAVSQP